MTETLLIYRLGSLGDTIVALPCFNKIVERFPGHKRLVLTNHPVSNAAPAVEAILRNGGFVHGSIAYPYGTRSPSLLYALVRRLRAVKADTLVYLGGGRGLRAVYRDLVFLRLAGIRHVVGAPVSRDLEVGRVDAASGLVEYEASRLARCLQPLGHIDVTDPASWDLRLTGEEVAAAKARLGALAGQPFIAAHAGGKLPIQDWGVGNWQALLTRLGPHARMPLVFVGSAADGSRARLLAPHWGHPVLDTCGQLTPRESAALLRYATIFVGHDSGPLHLAAASDVPCVAVFGNNNPPGKWYPRGPQHRIHYDGVGVGCIPPEQVAASVMAGLEACGRA